MSRRKRGLHTDMPTILKGLQEPEKADFRRLVCGYLKAQQPQKMQAGEIASDTELATDCGRYKLEFVEAGQVRVTKDGRLVGCLRRQLPNP